LHDRAAVLALGVAEEAAWFGEPELSAEEVGEWIDEEAGSPEASWLSTSISACEGSHRPAADPIETDTLTDVLRPWLPRSTSPTSSQPAGSRDRRPRAHPTQLT
jgi:hypothetical protein